MIFYIMLTIINNMEVLKKNGRMKGSYDKNRCSVLGGSGFVSFVMSCEV